MFKKQNVEHEQHWEMIDGLDIRYIDYAALQALLWNNSLHAALNLLMTAINKHILVSALMSSLLPIKMHDAIHNEPCATGSKQQCDGRKAGVITLSIVLSIIWNPSDVIILI